MKLKPIINKKNGQVNISLPKKKLPKNFVKDLDKISKINVTLEGWELK